MITRLLSQRNRLMLTLQLLDSEIRIFHKGYHCLPASEMLEIYYLLIQTGRKRLSKTKEVRRKMKDARRKTEHQEI